MRADAEFLISLTTAPESNVSLKVRIYIKDNKPISVFRCMRYEKKKVQGFIYRGREKDRELALWVKHLPVKACPMC